MSPGEKIWQNAAEGTGIGASYLITGLAYSTDVILSVSAGVVAGVTVCSPFLLIDGASQRASEFSGECLGRVGVAVGRATNPNLGPKAFDGTGSWRCPDLDPLADGLVGVADCYVKNDDKARAREQLEAILNSEVFDNCLSEKSKTKIEKKLKSL